MNLLPENIVNFTPWARLRARGKVWGKLPQKRFGKPCINKLVPLAWTRQKSARK